MPMEGRPPSALPTGGRFSIWDKVYAAKVALVATSRVLQNWRDVSASTPLAS